MTATIDEFRDAVREAAKGTPYVVRAADGGFDVHLDIADASWFGLFNKAGLTRTHTHRVRLHEDGTYTLVDDVRSVDWVAGVPKVAATTEVVRGRVIALGREKVWAFDERGRFGAQADFRFDSEEGRELVTGVAEALGLRSRRGVEEKIGLVVALGTVIGLVVLGVAALVLVLTGVIPTD